MVGTALLIDRTRRTWSDSAVRLVAAIGPRLTPQVWLALVMVIGLAIRAVLLPLGYGQDFVVWNKASAATLHGINIYAHHPHYPAGPYAYFPLFVYLELPAQWLAEHGVLSFTVLGKIPILLGDVLVTWLIAAELADRGRSPRVAAAGAAAFFLNPVVLDNSALYGRFDSLGLAFLLLALRYGRRAAHMAWKAAFCFALAVATKTFPGFIVLGMVRIGRRQIGWALGATLGLLSLPYLGSLPAYLHDIVFYNTVKHPQALSWQRVLLDMVSRRDADVVGYGLLVAFIVVLVALRNRLADLQSYTVVVLLTFILTSKVVLSHYLTWPMPWLIIRMLESSAGTCWPSVAIMAVFTIVALQMNPYVHPFGQYPELAAYIVAITAGWYIGVVLNGRSRVPVTDGRYPRRNE